MLWLFRIAGHAVAFVVLGLAACAGILLDRWRASLLLWAAVLVVVALGVATHAVAQFPSLAGAVAKNGSLFAYVVYGFNMGLPIAFVFAMVHARLFRRLAREDHPRNPGEAA